MADNPSVSGKDLILKSIEDTPSAAKELLVDAYHHPWDTTKHVAKVLGESAVAGVVLGSVIPSRGPAALATGLLFMAPMAVGEYRRYKDALDQLGKPGANEDQLARNLARGNATDLGNLGLSFIGGGIGTSAGHFLASSDSALGSAAQTAQRGILKSENNTMLALGKVDVMKPFRGFSARTVVGDAADATSAEPATGAAWFTSKNSALDTRLQQASATPADWTVKHGTFHGHFNGDDGMGTAAQNYGSAKASGLDFYEISPHNHIRARDGVEDNVRIDAEKDVPLIANDPAGYTQLVKDAATATEDGKFVALAGNELGTIGRADPKGGTGIEGHSGETGSPSGPLEPSGSVDIPVENIVANTKAISDGQPTVTRTVFEPDGTVNVHEHVLPQEAVDVMQKHPEYQTMVHDHDHGFAPAGQAGADGTAAKGPIDWAKTHHGNGNHIGSVGNDVMMIADFQPQPQSLMTSMIAPVRRFLGMKSNEAPQAATSADGTIHYANGDLKSLLTQIADKDVWLGFNHPRDNIKFDYGMPSFASKHEWATQMGQKARYIEIIKGEALNPNPVDVMKPQDLAPAYMSIYNSFGAVKEPGAGVHLGPAYGRDDHYAIPGARPAATGIMLKSSDIFNKDSIMGALGERRTMATTNYKLLSGYMTANDRFPMGSILDQGAVNDLSLKMNLGTNIDPRAQYTLNLWGDTNLLDSKLATKIQSKSVTGQDLLDTNGQFSFDTVHHTLGNKSNWYVEVQRTDPGNGNVDYMWTAPVWVEPLAGSSHALWTRAAVAGGTQYIIH